jgi:murein DD-endopeptidase MepM/ murein hydrolase activator NlpD
VSRAGWFAGGLVAAAGIGMFAVVPIVMSVAATFGGTDLKAGVAPAAMVCGDTVKIRQVSVKAPKVGDWSAKQVGVAATIVKVGEQLHVPPRGWVIAVATGMQESGLTNLGNLGKRNDHDSLGVFQQRPSTGWGTPAQTMDVTHAATSFYQSLLKVPGWQQLPLTKAAQKVQKSAYPNAYAKWEDDASKVVDAVSGGAANTPVDAPAVGACAAGTDVVASSGWVRPVSAPLGDGFHTRGGEHMGIDLIAKRGTAIHAAAAGTVIHMECDRTELGYHCDHDGSAGAWPGGCGWYVDIRHADDIITRYCHMGSRPLVDVGDKVTAGQTIGYVGSTGHSSGPHLHFEVHRGSRDSSSAIDPVAFMKTHGAPLGTSGQGGEKAA